MHVDLVALTRMTIDAEALTRAVSSHAAGAVALFLGNVRAETNGAKTLVALDYEAYEEMALVHMTDIRAKAVSDMGILEAAVVHRLGRIPLGEASIAVIVSSAHRPQAFDTCRWIVERVKADVPIWKKDVWSDGTTQWVDPTA